ncbi:MAG TPA: XRE family transcriptional regulator [Kofleriaceae bacterium]|nr:XRE family transcriptional regulator [Kofleriaceae bacterium]
MTTPLANHLGDNVKLLRDARGLTQARVARLAGIPRATWANLESGAANPTLSVLHRVAVALQVSIEELISTPRASCRLYPRGSLPVRTPGQAVIRRLLPDPVAGMEMDRIELPPRARFTGVPHTPGTREYLTCETGELVLNAAGAEWKLSPGDVIVFRGDQKHAYVNPAGRPAVGYSVVILAPIV